MTRIRIPKTALALTGVGLGIVIMLVVLFSIGWGGVQQPIEFSHKIHADNGLDCIDCHRYYKEHAASGRPTLEICANCHSDLIGKSTAEKALLKYIKAGQEISWIRLFRVPPDVYFSHRRHVVLGGLACAMCHLDIGTSTKPPSRVREFTMPRCLACHERSHVSNDCINCHR